MPKTVIGVLGNTGVGKSSLLNALLGEASILPTSGSRGCTAAVVELTYNDKLLTKRESSDNNLDLSSAEDSEVSVYEGTVEFIRFQDWFEELDLLFEEVDYTVHS